LPIRVGDHKNDAKWVGYEKNHKERKKRHRKVGCFGLFKWLDNVSVQNNLKVKQVICKLLR